MATYLVFFEFLYYVKVQLGWSLEAMAYFAPPPLYTPVQRVVIVYIRWFLSN